MASQTIWMRGAVGVSFLTATNARQRENSYGSLKRLT